KGVTACPGDGQGVVVPIGVIGRAAGCTADRRRGLVYVDVIDGAGVSNVAGVVNAAAGVGYQGVHHLGSQRLSAHGVGVEARLHAARVGAGEVYRHISVVPALGIGCRSAAARDHRLGLVNTDVNNAGRSGAVAGVVFAGTVDGLARAFAGYGYVQGAGSRTAGSCSGGVDGSDQGGAVGAGEFHADVGVVPAIGVGRGQASRCQTRRRGVYLDHHRHGGGAGESSAVTGAVSCRAGNIVGAIARDAQ